MCPEHYSERYRKRYQRRKHAGCKRPASRYDERHHHRHQRSISDERSLQCQIDLLLYRLCHSDCPSSRQDHIGHHIERRRTSFGRSNSCGLRYDEEERHCRFGSFCKRRRHVAPHSYQHCTRLARCSPGCHSNHAGRCSRCQCRRPYPWCCHHQRQGRPALCSRRHTGGYQCQLHQSFRHRIHRSAEGCLRNCHLWFGRCQRCSHDYY